MHAGSHYTLKEFILWTRRDIYVLILIATIPTVVYSVFGCTWLAIPWVPVAMVGTGAVFIVGFKNTQTYNRLWEARQIWGAIVNSSRSWGIMSKHFVKTDNAVHQQLIYRHCAWLTALRFQLRKPAAWENTNKLPFKEFRQLYKIPEWEDKLEDELMKYLPAEELQYILSKKNRATQILALQSKSLKELQGKSKIDLFKYLQITDKISELYEHQGKCERIKNFPYPRQFASINLFFVWLFVILVPFGMLNEFQRLGQQFVWLTIPFSVIVSWVFISMDRVGEATENPFEGGANDIPMAAMSRTIEIDLRDMLDEKDLPAPLLPVHNILM